MVDSLLSTLSQISPLNTEDQGSIADLCEIVELDSGDSWFREGMYAKKVAYIHKGYLRKYFLREAQEKTDFFYFEGMFTGDLPSILSNTTCKSYNVAMEPTTLVAMSYAGINKLAEKSHGVERMMRLMVEQGFATYYHRATSFILQTPLERYEEMLKTYPQILQRATQYHIASYLGITPQHLSRLRASK